MANQRTTFAKRQREQNKKDKFLAKQQRLAARRAEAQQLKDSPPVDSSDNVVVPAPTSAPTDDVT